MEERKVKWLPHLTPEIVSDARGGVLDSYMVALEGWRRGLTLKWHVKDSEKFKEMKTWFVDKPGLLFSLSSKEKTHYFFRTRGDKVTNEAVEIAADKDKTKEYLKKANVRTPEGKRFTNSSEMEKEILDYAATLGYPVVLKPTDGSFGRGVLTNIRDEEELIKGITYLRTQYNYTDVIVEKFIPGNEYRLYVVDDKVAGAIRRVPANVIGDGESTIEQLIEQKNELRSENPRLTSCLIKVNEEIEHFIGKSGYTLQSVPEKGEQVFLYGKSNISIGGDPIDVFDELPEEVKETAIRALRSIPGLYHGSVDLIIETGKPVEEAVVVLELNPTSQIGAIMFPMEGMSRDVPAAIIDFYFPETKDVYSEKESIYFDFHDVLEPLISRTATTSTVTPAPLGKLYKKKYIVSGDVQDLGYHYGLRKQAFERKLNGFISNLENGDIEIVVLGTDKEMVDDFKNGILEDPERSTVESIREEPYDGPVKVGFEVKGDLKLKVKNYPTLLKELHTLKKEVKEAEKEYRKVHRTLSWQITYPVRQFLDLVKYIKRKI